MLALVSTAATRRLLDVAEVSRPPARRNGRAKAKASRPRAAARRSRRSQLSSRLRRVSRGGDGVRNMSELNGTSPLRRPADQVEHDRRGDRQQRRAT